MEGELSGNNDDGFTQLDMEAIDLGNVSNLTEALEDFEEFDSRDAINVAAYSFMSAIGIVLNTMVLITAGRQATQSENKQDYRMKTNVHYLVFQLTIADMVCSYITMPMEAAWRLTIEWFAGNMMCKALMTIRVGGFYLSSNILVVLSIDRYLVISRPLATIHIHRQRRRARLMVVGAWIAAILFASPQAIVFRVLKHPEKDFYQCVTIGFWESVATSTNLTLSNGTNVTTPLILGMTVSTVENMYSFFFMAAAYFFPLIALIASYTSIIIFMQRRSNIFSVAINENQLRTLRESGQCLSQTSFRNSQRRRNNIKHYQALKMCIIHVVTFILSWTPYVFMASWFIIDKDSAKKVPALLQDGLFLGAVFNSCINPVVYGAYHFREMKNLGRRRATVRTCNISFRTTKTMDTPLQQRDRSRFNIDNSDTEIQIQRRQHGYSIDTIDSSITDQTGRRGYSIHSSSRSFRNQRCPDGYSIDSSNASIRNQRSIHGYSIGSCEVSIVDQDKRPQDDYSMENSDILIADKRQQHGYGIDDINTGMADQEGRRKYSIENDDTDIIDKKHQNGHNIEINDTDTMNEKQQVSDVGTVDQRTLYTIDNIDTDITNQEREQRYGMEKIDSGNVTQGSVQNNGYSFEGAKYENKP